MPESALRLIQADLEWLLSKVHLGPFVYLLLFYGSSALKSQERLSKELTLSFIYKMLQDSNLMLPKSKYKFWKPYYLIKANQGSSNVIEIFSSTIEQRDTNTCLEIAWVKMVVFR